jgi:hypothetical protein
MSAASSVNVVRTFLSAGITFFLDTDGRLYCRNLTDRARCLIVWIDPSRELEPPDGEVDELERELYLEHCVDGVRE